MQTESVLPVDPELWRTRREPAGGQVPAAAVLVHGAMDRGASFGRLTNRLTDWEVITYDRRGYGRSAPLGPPADFASQVDDLVAVVSSCAGSDLPVVAFGHSLGGDVVLAAAARHPSLFRSALVWEPPQPWLPFWREDRRQPEDGGEPAEGSGGGGPADPEEEAERFMRRMVGDRIWERLPQATRDQRRKEGRTLAAELASLAAGPVFDPARIRIPVLVGRGGRSRPHHRRGSRELAAALPSGELVEVADADHGAHLSHPGEVAALLRRAATLGGVQAPPG